ncbi:MAG: hypothetical protein R3C02_21545 [Planctomycetaceae bacterium]
MSGYSVKAREHLLLVGVSMLGAITIAIPLGVLSAKWSRLGQFVLGLVDRSNNPISVLFVVLIPFLGVGPMPAICALFLYSLLPIVRNTHAGLVNIPETLRESALACWDFHRQARLRDWIELSPGSEIDSCGSEDSRCDQHWYSTLGGLYSMRGYGNQSSQASARQKRPPARSAIPAALMALIAQGVFEWLQRWSVPQPSTN